jgi:hypothetical protein
MIVQIENIYYKKNYINSQGTGAHDCQKVFTSLPDPIKIA